ncbi:hypothetical protein CVS30_09605 [Arthrobacter psychrolactophilus]|uniref:Uncharacterized protein n=1 Tax=Arthrobacter psychrolactophilus TaxID=92442 RepID=A0A2V5IPS8_9MICC|nr:hypothetical protein [Arthrobacter psychrolactophilus]PYI38575.1 hypothetical protein CVS30_09605 [Arthrobacter psychrolactophilus]
MTLVSPLTGRTLPLMRRRLAVAMATAAVIFLTACSGASTGDSSATSSATVATTPSPTASATADAVSTAAASAETAVKELVAGFPTTVMPLMKGAQIQASSLQHGQPVSLASLTATVTAPSADVVSNYTKVFTDQGFKAQPGDSVDGVPLKTFVRAEGQEIVTVSVVQTGATATFTLGATLLPASFK